VTGTYLKVNIRDLFVNNFTFSKVRRPAWLSPFKNFIGIFAL
jgi:hypothetical protein